MQALDNEAGNDLDIISSTVLSCPFTEDESSSESLSDSWPKVTQTLVARPGSEPKDLGKSHMDLVLTDSACVLPGGLHLGPLLPLDKNLQGR